MSQRGTVTVAGNAVMVIGCSFRRRRNGRHSADGAGSSVAGRPVRARNTSSSVGRRRPTSSIGIAARASAWTARVSWSVPASTATLTRRFGSSSRGASTPNGASRSPARARSSARRTRISTTSRPAWRFSSSGVPVAIARPWSTMTTWSASWSASSRYCVVSRTSVPAATRARIASHSSRRLRGSRPGRRLVEQQQPGPTDEAGAEVEAPAHAARVVADEAVAGIGQPELGEDRGGRRGGPRSRPWPNSRATITRFSRPVSAGSTAAAWPARPMTRPHVAPGRATASMPATRNVPPSGALSVATERTNVVLPAPLGPSTAVTTPAGATRSRPSRAVTSPNCLRSPTASITGGWVRWELMRSIVRAELVTP